MALFVPQAMFHPGYLMGKSETWRNLSGRTNSPMMFLCLSAAYKFRIRLCEKMEAPDAQLSALQAGESFNDIFTFSSSLYVKV